MLERTLLLELLRWKDKPNRKPLILRGARQVGKSSIVGYFGRQHFSQLVTINFELQPGAKACFITLSPQKIIQALELLQGVSIRPEDTLLFLDEIQECPEAITALRYFKEQYPALAVIAAGSLLEFTLQSKNFHMPVGRVEFLYMYPLSFQEYLKVIVGPQLYDYLSTLGVGDAVLEPIHHQLLEHVQNYMMLGGMPEVLAYFVAHRDFRECRAIQMQLLNTYRNDFGKYASGTGFQHLQSLFVKLPGMVCEQFSYVKAMKDVPARDIRAALDKLENAGLIYRVYATAASGLPLAATINEKKFKVLFLDIGLVQCALNTDLSLLVGSEYHLINRGQMTEQLVGQMLLAMQLPITEARLYFWMRDKVGSQAEVDYVLTFGELIVPIEVKSGSLGRLKSLQQFMQTHQSPLGIRICASPLAFDKAKKILSVPFYLVPQLDRLVKAYLHQ